LPDDRTPSGAADAPPPRRWLASVDRAIDGELNRYFSPTERSRTGEVMDKYAVRIEDSLQRATDYAKRTKTSLDTMGDDYIARMFGGWSGAKKPKSDEANIYWLTKRPKTVVAVVVIIALLVAIPAVNITGSERLGVEPSMRGDFEVFLPPSDETTKILQEVRQYWSTDAMFIYGEIQDPETNVTDISILKALSAIEGDDDHPGPPKPADADGYQEGVDWSACGIDPWRDDKGDLDGVTAILSIPVIVKAANQTSGRVISQLPGNYSIPNEQALVDRIVNNMPSDVVRSMVVDVDQNGVYDHFCLIVLLYRDPKVQKEVMLATQELLDGVNKEWAGTMQIWLTGPTPVIQAMQVRTITEFLRVMPLVVIALILSLWVFHRTFRVVPIALIPVSLALLMSLGIVGAMHSWIIITPQVVIVAPVLLSLGVSYGLYISNRFAEEPESDPPEKRLARATKAINPAIFLSAATTAIGFASLMIGTLPPIFTMGLGLTIGIALTYLLVYLLVPCFVMIFKYKKKAQTSPIRSFATVPSRNRKKIIAFALIAATISVAMIPLVRFDADYLNMAPKDEPAVVKMQEYSRNMGGGQMGMVLIRSDPYEYSTLSAMARIEADINGVKDTQGISVITIMKAVSVPATVEVAGFPVPVPPIAQKSLWDAVVWLNENGFPGAAQQLVDTFYQALPVEVREMLITSEGREALIYCFQPFMDIDRTRAAVDGVNAIVATYNDVYGEKFCSKLTGIAAITLAVNDLIIIGQINSLAVCMFLTWLILAITFRSVFIGLVTCIPVGCVIALEPGTLVGLGIPLSTITIMIGSIAIGTGVDFGIQITQRVRLGKFTLPSVFSAVENAGTSFYEATVTMLAGFFMVLFIPIDSIREFVVMIMVLLSYNAIFALLVLPAVYTIIIRRREVRSQRERERGPATPWRGRYERGVRRIFGLRDVPPASSPPSPPPSAAPPTTPPPPP